MNMLTLRITIEDNVLEFEGDAPFRDIHELIVAWFGAVMAGKEPTNDIVNRLRRIEAAMRQLMDRQESPTPPEPPPTVPEPAPEPEPKPN